MSTAPKRIQRKRTKGWQMPEGAVYVGRPTKWGNPWKVGAKVMRNGQFSAIETPAEAVEMFRRKSIGDIAPFWGEKLRGKDLACWCPLDAPCHADVLLEWAND